jgi:molybdopterin synthase sulfur carrier subunit
MPILRFFAAARAAAGVAEESTDATSLAQALEQASSARDARFRTVLSLCSFLVDGQPVGTRDHDGVQLSEGSVVDCLPPFAGG